MQSTVEEFCVKKESQVRKQNNPEAVNSTMATPKYPILDTRISFCSSIRNDLATPLDSETGWTGEL